MDDELTCQKCGLKMPRRKGSGGQRKYCLECAAEVKRDREREGYRARNPGWEERRAAANELQRDFRERQHSRAELEAAKLMRDGSAEETGIQGKTNGRSQTEEAALEAQEMNANPALHPPWLAGAEIKKTEQITRYVTVEEKKVTVTDYGVTFTNPEVKAGPEPIWKSILRRDVLSDWADDPNAGGLEEIVEKDGEKEIRRLRRIPESKGSAGFLAIQAASGDALRALANGGRPRPEHAEQLIAYLAAVLDQHRACEIFKKLQGVTDANGKTIRPRFQPDPNPSSLSAAIVELARKEEAA